MKRLLLLSNMGPSKQKPNSGRFVYNQYQALKQGNEFAVEFFYLNQDEKGKLGRLLRYPLFFLRFIAKYFVSAKQDIIHVHFFFPNILLALIYKYLRNPKVKLFATFHGSDVYLYQPPSKLYRWAFAKLDHAIFVSDSLLQRFQQHIQVKSDQVTVLSAGILSDYQAAEDSHIEYDAIFVGHQNYNKGMDRLQKVAKKGVKIAVVGEGATSQQASQNGNMQLDFYGVVPPNELVKLYRSSRYLLSLSRNESFGLVMTEAMASGVPVIATETDGAKAQIKHGENGFLLNNCDTWLDQYGYEFIAKTTQVSGDDYEVMRNNAISSAQQHKLEHVLETLVLLYQKQFSKG